MNLSIHFISSLFVLNNIYMEIKYTDLTTLHSKYYQRTIQGLEGCKRGWISANWRLFLTNKRLVELFGKERWLYIPVDSSLVRLNIASVQPIILYQFLHPYCYLSGPIISGHILKVDVHKIWVDPKFAFLQASPEPHFENSCRWNCKTNSQTLEANLSVPWGFQFFSFSKHITTELHSDPRIISQENVRQKYPLNLLSLASLF